MIRRWFVILPLVLVAAAAVGYIIFQHWLDTPLTTGNAAVQFEIPPGQPLAATASELEKLGWLGRPRWLLLHARLTRPSPVTVDAE